MTPSTDGEAVYLVDPIKDSIYSYSLSGKQVREIASPDIRDPEALARTDEGYILENRDGNFVVFDADFKKRWELTLIAARSGAQLATAEEACVEIRRVYGWIPISDNQLLAFVDLKICERDDHDPANWVSAIAILPISENVATFHVVQDFQVGNSAVVPYQLFGRQWFAVTDSAAYYLTIDGGLKLAKLQKTANGEAMTPQPQFFDLSERFICPDFHFPADYNATQALFHAIETSSCPAALLRSGNRAFLVYRGQDALEGKILWYTSEVSLKAAGDGNSEFMQVSEPVQLELDANHIFADSSDDRWIILEKGPRLGFAQQEFRSLLFISENLVK